MARYVTRASIPHGADCDWWQNSPPPSLTVDERVPVDTGLLAPDGRTIFRMPNPIGFGRDDEW